MDNENLCRVKRLFASLQGPRNQSCTMLRKVKHTTHILFVHLYAAAPLRVLLWTLKLQAHMYVGCSL